MHDSAPNSEDFEKSSEGSDEDIVAQDPTSIAPDHSNEAINKSNMPSYYDKNSHRIEYIRPKAVHCETPGNNNSASQTKKKLKKPLFADLKIGKASPAGDHIFTLPKIRVSIDNHF